MRKLVNQVLKIPYGIFNFLAYRGFFNWIPDKPYLKIQYKAFFGCKLNLDNPKTFNEKIQWLKLHDRNSLYITMSDKFAVKEYIREKLGKDYVIPLIGGPWKNADEINFDELPNQFVLKCTHDSGGLVICRDKNTLDKKAAKKILNKSLSKNYFYWCREWAYKDIKPLIIAEKYMENLSTSTSVQVPVLNDYKLQCFDGKFDNIFVAEGRFSERGVRYHYFDHNWNYIPYCPYDDINIHDLEKLKPSCFEEMIEIAEKLSEGLPELRVDLYEITGKVYFGELTFYSQSGFDTDITHEADCILGSKLILPNLN